jgi:oligopeptide transport system permease protein
MNSAAPSAKAPPAAAAPTPAAAPVVSRNRPWRRFRRSRLAVAGAVLITAMTLACVLMLPWSLGQVEGQPRYNRQMAGPILVPPSAVAMLGTDELGRSLLPRVLFGGSISLGIGLAAAFIAVTIGVAWGAVAGYVGGRVDGAMMRIVDVLYGLPYILLVILIKLALETPLAALLRAAGVANAGGAANVVILFVAIGSVSWLTMARVVRGQVLSLKARPFVEAARASGAGGGRILVRHILPNLVGPVLVYATLIVPQAILQESFLSFLGIGIAPPVPTWGSLAAEGVQYLNSIRIYWWLVLWPCVALALTLLSLNFLGDGLRDALDPTSGQ